MRGRRNVQNVRVLDNGAGIRAGCPQGLKQEEAIQRIRHGNEDYVGVPAVQFVRDLAENCVLAQGGLRLRKSWNTILAATRVSNRKANLPGLVPIRILCVISGGILIGVSQMRDFSWKNVSVRRWAALG